MMSVSLRYKVIYCSDVKKIMALATSSTVAILYRGMLEAALLLNYWYSASLMPVYLYRFVSMVVG